MLTPQRRQQLDSIVMDLAKKNAPQSDVQLIVNDFKSKYENEDTEGQKPIQPAEKSPEDISIGEKMFSSKNPLEGKGGILEKVGGVVNAAKNLQLGTVKGTISTFERATNLAAKGINYLKNKATGQEEEYQPKNILPDYMSQAEGTMQAIGKGVEQLGEFMVPAGLTAKLAKIGEAGVIGSKIGQTLASGGKIAKTALGAAKAGARAIPAAAEAAAVTAAQTGGDKKEMQRNAMIAGAIPFVGAAFSSVGKGLLTKAGQKIQTSLIKPSQADIKDGFSVENLSKYGIGGDLETMGKQVHNKITQLATQLKSALTASDVKINAKGLIDDVEKEMVGSRPSNFGFNSKVANAFKHFKGELDILAKDGMVDISDAQQIKRSLGKIGAWQYGVKDPDANAMETVANKLYSKFRSSIEAASPGDVAGINKQLSELIPIESAIIRRVPVHARNNAMSLSDAVTAIPAAMHPASWWLFVLNRASKSGKVGSALIKAGKESTEQGPIKSIIYGNKTPLTPAEQKAAEKISTVLNAKPGMTIEVSPKVRELNKTIQRFTKAMEQAKQRGASTQEIKRYDKAIKAAIRQRNKI